MVRRTRRKKIASAEVALSAEQYDNIWPETNINLSLQVEKQGVKTTRLVFAFRIVGKEGSIAHTFTPCCACDNFAHAVHLWLFLLLTDHDVCWMSRESLLKRVKALDSSMLEEKKK